MIHPDILADVHAARATPPADAPKVAPNPFMDAVVQQARAMTAQRELMAYLAHRFTVTGLEAPQGMDLRDWQLHRASEAGVIAHIYQLAQTRMEERHG